MTSTVDSEPQALVLPKWLQTCLLEEQAGSDTAEQSLICRAFNFAFHLHEGQYRASGDPYIAHPVAVAELLNDLGGSASMICAGFLHDIVEDTTVTPDQLEDTFGAEVRQLVEGVTKISKFNFSTKTEREAENFRKMFLAMARDVRVIVIKLADRLHNMRTLEHLSKEKQRRIAMETRDVFAPLANRLGIWRFKWELEDLSFKYLEPEVYRSIQSLVSEKRTTREALITEAVNRLTARLDPLGLKHLEVTGRPKHLYSIYKKMVRQQKEFHEIYDISAIRVIVGSNDECYRVLAIVHDLFRPIPGRFKDYIGLPKPNRYQSLHTTVIGLGGKPLEVQIRTLEMHHVAEYGIAAHWKYKEQGNASAHPWSPEDEKFTWLRQLLEWQSDLNDVSDDAQEYLDSVKDDLYGTEVYVFSPKGDLVPLAKGATPVDFAYRIHTEVGNHCYGAKVNGRMVTLNTGLKNGDIVEIMTQKSAHPSLDWLNFVTSTLARNRIRQWYKRSRREENIQRGRDLLEKELGKTGFDALLKSDTMHQVAEQCNYASPDDLLAGLGYGETTLNLVVNRLRELNRQPQSSDPLTQKTEESSQFSLFQQASSSGRGSAPSAGQDTPIAGVEGLVYNLAKCCHPLPGEPIIGVVTLSSRGISIHRQGCSNVESVPGDRLIPVSWNPQSETQGHRQTYPVNIQIEVLDRVGILNDILSRLKDLHINVNNAQVLTKRGQPALITLGLDIEHLNQLDRTFTQIRKMTDVLNLRRLHHSETTSS
ncbi:RelA/SpoT family protein [Lyngbya confervoides]|uniref:Bifunctional (P)ppGpp synthetase/guanosine-3',5'-bis(Diphosphate) 3'-pyrophosphohydrolase n=1 Tax=Lyngbya confervoides BDU141951 TaxID=1574623 RepID=A0ABD4T8C9_9CYAN|nr:bifunctional (p)ppGpp synthetase/guanosine-3',5'-bis(diphosphate) 3'-pyrophosphohydrolase [Lyngbya confervoides]MCM1984582.1 bifunctional (p)ppGpp synthetase/guanosine-3',5'-bis(diphosphate) 3'-pyrophosphohydrolase [Lyngbya confervoides BDU141951]